MRDDSKQDDELYGLFIELIDTLTEEGSPQLKRKLQAIKGKVSAARPAAGRRFNPQ
jgi:hypothetical protein